MVDYCRKYKTQACVSGCSYSNFVVSVEEKEHDFTWRFLFYWEGGLECE